MTLMPGNDSGFRKAPKKSLIDLPPYRVPICLSPAPERKSKPKKALIAVLATLASGFALLLFVFVRRAIQNASQDHERAAKLAAVHVGFARVVKP